MKVLITGDSPYLETGFGRVNRRAAQAFLRAGMEVGAVTALQTKAKPPTAAQLDSIPGLTAFVPDAGDEIGMAKIMEVCPEWKPDVIYGTGDPGNVGGFTGVIPARIPFVAYVPIEGEPIVHSGWRQVLEYINFFTCSEYGTRVVADNTGRTVPYVYHGVDTEVFTPLSSEERDAYRKVLGWEGKFVISCVAQNVRRKQLPRLIEAVSILKHQFKQKDILLYLHAVPYQQHWLEGWNLPEVCDAFDVHDEVVFNPFLRKRNDSVPEAGSLEAPGIRELVGSSDLFANPSQVEGFGLPFIEAMALGIPIMGTRYAAGWEIIKHAHGVGIPIHDWEIHKSGTKYGNVDQMAFAKEILNLRRNPKQLQRMSDAGLKALPLFDWNIFEEYVVRKVQDAASQSPAATGESDLSQEDYQTALEAAEDHFRHRSRQDRATASGSPLVRAG